MIAGALTSFSHYPPPCVYSDKPPILEIWRKLEEREKHSDVSDNDEEEQCEDEGEKVTN